MSCAQIQLLKYLWVGFRLSDRSVIAPNGKVICRVLDRTITECAHHGWIVLEETRYRLTDAGRQRVLVKERVREFAEQIAGESLGTMLYSEPDA